MEFVQRPNFRPKLEQWWSCRKTRWVTRQFGEQKKTGLHINNFSGEHDDEHGFTIRVVVNG